MFDKVGDLDFVSMEHKMLDFWEKEKIFDKLRKKNSDEKKRFSFLDGPITANNPMGVHHAWGRTYKDIYQRYKAMQGYQMRYQNGFDCQGLWVEVEVEKELGFKSKRDIENYGLGRFVEKCKERVRKYSQKQTEQSIRLGYWMDWNNSYYTMTDENNYTIWHFLKKCHNHGWVYRGTDVMPWCPRCGTALSEHEIVTEGYKELTHKSVFLKFPLLEKSNEALLVWTTTPWTLSSNTAAAVHPSLDYVKVKQGDEYLYLIESKVGELVGSYEIVERFKGKDLLGLKYKGPFDELPAQKGVIHKVITWEEITEKEGTGIVHIAPGCGKEDFSLRKEFSLSVIAPLDECGLFVDGFDFLTGKGAAEAAPFVFENLKQKGILYKLEDYTHRYPVCWRCGAELVFRLVDEWFIRMDELRHKIMDVTKKITWLPEFGMNQELDWLKNMHDWCISKKRYWGLALPIFFCNCGHFEVIGGYDELKEKAVEGWSEFEGNSPHRPWVDAVKIKCEKCGSHVSRIKDVGNPWLDAGIVPYSTMHYDTDRAYWEKWFPAEFITECFPGQFRNWFYSLLAMSTVMENREPFRTILGHALVKDEKGQDMHKSQGNAIWFDEAAEIMGADVMRYIFASHNPFNNLNFGYGFGEEVKRKLLTLWNSYSFFITYAELDNFNPDTTPLPVAERSLLDRWMIGKLNFVIQKGRENLDKYNVLYLMKLVDELIDDLSNWYIRRSRKRFWKSENDKDKNAAYFTLYEVLTTIIRLLAPSLPFLTEHIYQNLVRKAIPSAPESVHLTSYPEADEKLIDEKLIENMRIVQQVVSLGRYARNQASLKVRQPLRELKVIIKNVSSSEGLSTLVEQITEELNIKEVTWASDSEGLFSYEVKPDFKVVGKKYRKDVPKIKEALEKLSSEEIKEKIMGHDTFTLTLSDNSAVNMEKEDIELVRKPRENLSMAEEGDICVAIDTTLTEELIREGEAREFVRKIQNLRKEMNFEVDDRIEISFKTEEGLKNTINAFSDYIKTETLCVELKECEDIKEGTELDVNEKKIHVLLIKN
ncbi:MAG: isoleucine--tRNA ligase [Candidatus Eremiobacterota bacterium]